MSITLTSLDFRSGSCRREGGGGIRGKREFRSTTESARQIIHFDTRVCVCVCTHTHAFSPPPFPQAFRTVFGCGALLSSLVLALGKHNWVFAGKMTGCGSKGLAERATARPWSETDGIVVCTFDWRADLGIR